MPGVRFAINKRKCNERVTDQQTLRTAGEIWQGVDLHDLGNLDLGTAAQRRCRSMAGPAVAPGDDMDDGQSTLDIRSK
jgi:hypothetical protein